MTTFLLSLLSDASIYLGLPLGLWISFRVLAYPDLSVEYLFVLGGVGYALAVTSGWGLPVLVVGLVLASALLGAVCSLIRNRFGVHPVLISLAFAYIYYSVSLALLGGPSRYVGASAPPPSDAFAAVFAAALFGFILVVLVLLARTNAGLKVIAAGSNADLAARHQLTPIVWQGIGLAVSFFLVMVSGALYAWRAGNVDVSYGNGLLLISIFVVVVTRAANTRINMAKNGLLLATFLLGYLGLLQASLLFGLPPQWLRGVSATFLLLLVLVVPKRRGRLLVI